MMERLAERREIEGELRALEHAQIEGAGDWFGDFAAKLARRNRFVARVNSLQASISTSLARDNRMQDWAAAKAFATGENANRIVAVNASLNLNEFPPKSMDIQYRTLVHATAMQKQVGAWPLLTYDVLSAFADSNYLISEASPTLISRHPQTNLFTDLGRDEVLRLREFFGAARSWAEENEKKASSKGGKAAATAAVIVPIIRWTTIIYKVVDAIADEMIDSARRAQAVEKEKRDNARKLQLDDRLSRDWQMRLAPPKPDAVDWLQKQEAYDKFSRTA